MVKRYIPKMIQKLAFDGACIPQFRSAKTAPISNRGLFLRRLRLIKILGAGFVKSQFLNRFRYKRSLTLLEIMIVIVLIGLIGSVIGFNMKGSLDEGKAFKTRQAKEQIRDILMLEVARGVSFDEVVAKKEAILESSGLVKNAKTFLKDGWGVEFEVSVDGRGNDNIIVKSQKLKAYEKKKNDKLGKTEEPASPNDDD